MTFKVKGWALFFTLQIKLKFTSPSCFGVKTTSIGRLVGEEDSRLADQDNCSDLLKNMSPMDEQIHYEEKPSKLQIMMNFEDLPDKAGHCFMDAQIQ